MCGIDPASKWLFTRASHRIPKSWVSRVRVYTCTGWVLCAYTWIRTHAYTWEWPKITLGWLSYAVAHGTLHEGVPAIFDFSPPFCGHQSRMADTAKTLNRSIRSDYFLSPLFVYAKRGGKHCVSPVPFYIFLSVFPLV